MNKTIKFEFTFEQVNAILGGLGKAPTEVGMYPVQIIQEQAGPQVEAMRIEEAKELAKKGEKKDEQWFTTEDAE